MILKKITLLILLLTFSLAHAKNPHHAAIASADPRATQAGFEVLAKGGNAFDAAIAVSAVLAVVEPQSSGLGGGGFWLLHSGKSSKNVFLDAREVAPMQASEKMFLDKKGSVIPHLSLDGALSAAIPGQPAAWAYIAKHYAKLPLATDLAPAVRYAKDGFYTDDDIVQAIERRLPALKKYHSSSHIFLNDGDAPKVGALIRQPELANTLTILGEKGRDGFYKGSVAIRLVAGINQLGGIWALSDLANYKLKIRKPLIGRYKGATIITAPPPSAGGITILTILNIFSDYPNIDFQTVKGKHILIEAMRRAYWDRKNYLGDPDFVKIPLHKLLSKQHARKLRKTIKLDSATRSKTLDAKAKAGHESPQTTHLSIIDVEGNRVAATLSINYYFGSALVVPGTGVLLNDHMDDFSIKSGVPNVFGLVGSKPNKIEPGKRPLSSMSPTFLITKTHKVVIGTPGGSRIPTMILLSILDFMRGNKPISWVSLPRFHHQFMPDVVQYEKGALTLEQAKVLRKMGHHLRELKHPYGDMQAVQWNRKTHKMSAASDPRHIGLAETR